MHDWERLVRSHVGSLAPDPDRDAEIHQELAGHLQDLYDAARRRGCSDDEALAKALSEVGTWTALARGISAGEAKGGEMLDRWKTVYLPGAAISFAAAAIVIPATALGTAVWTDPRGWVHASVAGAMLTFYALLGAAAAAWSRSAGGSRRARVVAALAPALFQAAIVVAGIVEGAVAHVGAQHDLGRINPQLPLIAAVVVAPAAALLAGSWPFLTRKTVRE